MAVPQCSTNEVLIEGACFLPCPQYYTEASYVSPSACVLNVECPEGFSSGGDFTICQKPTESRTVVSPDVGTGDCPAGYTFWDLTCSSACSEGYSIFDGTQCTMDCPAGFLSSSQNCFKPVTIRSPVQPVCPINYAASANNLCFSTLPPFNAKLFWLVIGIGLLTFLLILFFTKDVSIHFESKSKSSTYTDFKADEEIPTRFLIDELRNHKSRSFVQPMQQPMQQQQTQPEYVFPISPSSQHSELSHHSLESESSVSEKSFSSSSW